MTLTLRFLVCSILCVTLFSLTSCIHGTLLEEKNMLKMLLAQLPQKTIKVIDTPYIANTKTGTAEGSAQNLDLYIPEGNGPFPLIVMIHGGGWIAGTKDLPGAALAQQFIPQGFAVASLNYRLVQDAPFPAQIEDCNAALAWLREHAKEYHLDSSKIAIAGYSAGAQLAGLMILTQGTSAFRNSGDAVQAGILWACPADLTKETGAWPKNGFMDIPFNPFWKFYPNSKYDAAFAKNASPLYHVRKGAPPIFMMHGKKDEVVPLSQAIAFTDALKKANVDVTLQINPNDTHDDVGSSGDYEAELAFLQRVLKTSKAYPPIDHPGKR